MRRILFVCTGNTCRSPMAAALLLDMLSKKGIDGIEVKSAGIMAEEGMAASENAVKAMEEKGMDISRHAASKLTAEMLADAEKVYVMTEGHSHAITKMYPQFSWKVKVMGNGISDPFGGDIEIYRSVRDAIYSNIKEIVQDFTDEI